MPAKSLLAQLMARQEGFGIKGAIPTVRHNPGDLRHSPHSQHPGGPEHANDVGTIDNDDDGWADLERQLQWYANEGLTLRQMINVYCGLPANASMGMQAPDNNNVKAYLAFVCNGLGMPSTAPVKLALAIPASKTPVEPTT